jgi:hypothetical protein
VGRPYSWSSIFPVFIGAALVLAGLTTDVARAAVDQISS